MTSVSVFQLLQGAFDLAAASHYPIRESWVNLSFRLSGSTPHGTMAISVQRIGDLDVLLRSLEAETASGQVPEGITADSNHILLAELWVGSAYEIFRVLKSYIAQDVNSEIHALAYDLALVRMPLEKYQVQGDRGLQVPIELERWPSRDGDMPLVYDSKNPTRTYIVPKGRSARGSVQWAVIDAKSKEQFWIERLMLSERIVGLLDRWPS